MAREIRQLIIGHTQDPPMHGIEVTTPFIDRLTGRTPLKSRPRHPKLNESLHLSCQRFSFSKLDRVPLGTNTTLSTVPCANAISSPSNLNNLPLNLDRISGGLAASVYLPPCCHAINLQGRVPHFVREEGGSSHSFVRSFVCVRNRGGPAEEEWNRKRLLAFRRNPFGRGQP